MRPAGARVLPPLWPTMFTAHVKGLQRGKAGNLIFYNDSLHHNVTLSGVWYYDWPRNRMRGDLWRVVSVA